MTTGLLAVRFVHLVSAAVWLGGLITLAALIPALRKAGAERPMLQATARQFGRVSWTAMALALVTGVAQVELLGLPWTMGRLHMKLGMVGLTVLLAGVHQLTARNSSPAARGIVQLLILLASLGVFWAAVGLARGG